MSGELILLVDDETSILQLARLYLERDGYRTHSVRDGLAALAAVKQISPDLMVLDIMIPEMDGFDVCRRLRVENHPIPILILTARDDDIDKILGLELGADDYLTKPFNPRELVARVRAILRRGERCLSDGQADSYHIGDLTLDISRREVRIGREAIPLRTQEFEVLRVLMQNEGLVLSRDRLLSLAWGYDFAGQTRTVDVHIAQLRRKLAKSCVKIETVTGVGYKLVK